MQPFTVLMGPDEATVHTAGRALAADRVVVEAGKDTVPRVSVWATGTGDLTGTGIVQVVTDPTPEDVRAAARDLLVGVNVQAFEERCAAKVRTGRRDPYRVALEVLGEFLDG